MRHAHLITTGQYPPRKVGQRLCHHSQGAQASSSMMTSPGVEDGEEFDDATKVTAFYCKPVSVEEFENQAETETERAISDLMDYLDSHKDEFTEHMKRKKRQSLENGGVMSFVKVKMMDFIHGSNSPLMRVTEKERDKKLEDLKFNMKKAFDVSQETKGRRVSKRLQEKQQRRVQENKATPSRMQAPLTCSHLVPPPPPPVPPFIQGTTPTRMKATPRKPFTPIENRMTEFKTPNSLKAKQDNLSLGCTPNIDCSLTSLHEELLSSHPWKRLKCVNDNRSPGGTPARKASSMRQSTEPLHMALVNKFKNIRSPSPCNSSVTSPGGFTP